MKLFDRLFDKKYNDFIENSLCEYEAGIAKIVLLCIEDLPFDIGVGKVAQILMGHQTVFLTEHGFTDNRMFGKLQQFSKLELTYIIKMLAVHRYIVVRDELKVFDVVSVSPKGTSFIEGRRKLDFHFLDTITETHTVQLDEDDFRFVNALKKRRMELAMQDTGKAYDICSDVDLMKIAHARPSTVNELEVIDGFDTEFIKKYGNDFIEVIMNIVNAKDTAD